jgi:hypothetical protein
LSICGRVCDANDIHDYQLFSGGEIESSSIHAEQLETFIIAIEERILRLILLLQLLRRS